jgi:CIC family chloride channel protein
MHVAPPAFAMVGMAAVLAGAVNAPLTAIILLFEMTNDYLIILPLMFAVVVSGLITQRLVHGSVYSIALARKGIRLDHGRDIEVLETIKVEEVMRPAPETLSDTETLAEAAGLFQQSHHHGLPVLNQDHELVGILTLQDLERVQDEDLDQVSVGQACTRELITVTCDDTIGYALRKMGTHDIGHMPVIDSEDPRTLVGWLGRSDLIKSYEIALARRAAARHRLHQSRLGAFSGENVRVLEIPVQAGAPCDGKAVKEIAWPANCLVTSLRRGQNVIIPKGETILRAGSILVVVVAGDIDEQVRKVCQCEQGSKTS